MKNIFLKDVLGQPDAIQKALKEYLDYSALFSAISKLKYRDILFCGMGSSHYCSQPSVIRLGNAGIPARMESASEVLHYEWGAIREDSLLVLTSQSGESGEIVDIIERLPSSHTVIGITNDLGSTLGKRANYLFEMKVENEIGVSTRTFLASIVLSDMITSALLREPINTDPILSSIKSQQALLREYEHISHQIEEQVGQDDYINYIGRGHSRTTAESAALFTRETAKCSCSAFDSGEFRHGPFEVIDEHFCAMLFAPEGPSFQMQLHLAEAITHLNGKVVFVTSKDVVFTHRNFSLIQHPPVDERLAPIVQIVVPQLYINNVSLGRGLAPGVLRQSNKITKIQ